MKLMPYLMFDGNCREAFAFYAQVLRGQILHTATYGDMAAMGSGGPPIPDAMKPRVANTHLLAGGADLMGSDSFEGQEDGNVEITTVNIDVDSVEEAERIFAELSAGGSVRMPIGETAWAQRFGMFSDRYGKPWMVNCSKPMPGAAP